MIGNIGLTEIIIVLVVALLVFGPKKLPEMGKAIGSAVTEFKRGLSTTPDNNTEPKEPPKLYNAVDETEKEKENKENTSEPAG